MDVACVVRYARMMQLALSLMLVPMQLESAMELEGIHFGQRHLVHESRDFRSLLPERPERRLHYIAYATTIR